MPETTRFYRVRICHPDGTTHAYIDRMCSPSHNRSACTLDPARMKTWKTSAGAKVAGEVYEDANPGMRCIVVDAATGDPAR